MWLKGNSKEKDIHAEARRATVCQTEPPTESAAWCATCEQGAIDRQHINRTSPGVTAIDGQHINRLLEIYPVVFAGRYWSFIRSNIVVRRALALIKWVFVFR